MCKICRCLIFYLLIGISSTIFARQNEEEGAERGFDWNLNIAGVTFLGNNSYFGESADFLGANTDDWTEAAVEVGFRVLYRSVGALFLVNSPACSVKPGEMTRVA